MKALIGRVRFATSALGLAALLCSAGCGASQTDGETTPGGGGGGEEVVEIGEIEGGDVAEAPTPDACTAWGSDDADPMRRWLPAFPIERGGVVMTFTGTSAEQMEVEATLEMRGISGYEAVACETAVILWVPGLDCEEQAPGIADAVQEGTTMSHYGTACFLLDEVRPRLAEECERGIIPEERCR